MVCRRRPGGEDRARSGDQQMASAFHELLLLRLGIVVPRRLFVLIANELDELLIEQHLMAHTNRERFRVSLWIIDGHVNLEMAEIRPSPTLDELALRRQRAAVYVEPTVVTKADRFDDERVALPTTDGITVPPRLQLFVDRGQRPTVHVDLAQPLVAFVHDHDELGRLHDLAWLRMTMQLHEAH